MSNPMMRDLDDVLLSPAAVDGWSAVVAATMPALVATGVLPDQIPTEQAEELPDGSLRIFVRVPTPGGGTVEPELIVPAGQWTWRTELKN